MLRRLITAALILACSGLSPARAEDHSQLVQAKIQRWKEKRATHPGNFGIFNRSRLFKAIKEDRVKLMGFDRERGANKPTARTCEFVVIRSLTAFKNGYDEKVLAIPTRYQPVCIADFKSSKSKLLGRMIRNLLVHPTERESLAGSSKAVPNKGSWVVTAHLPEALTMPTLHLHGLHRPRPVRDRITDWNTFITKHDYRLARKRTFRSQGCKGYYELFTAPAKALPPKWDVIAVAHHADGTPIPLTEVKKSGGKMDRVVARMMKDVYQLTVSRGHTFGQVLLDGAEEQLTLRSVLHK